MPSKIVRYVGIVTLLWAFVLMYMGFNLFQLVEESRRSSQELNKVSIEALQLRRENERLQKENIAKNTRVIKNDAQRTNREAERDENNRNNELLHELDGAKVKIRELERKFKSFSVSESSDNYEILRRRIAKQIREMWFYLSAQFTKVNKLLPDTARNDFMKVLENFGEMQRITEHDFEELISMDGAQDIRDASAKRLSEVVQKRLYNLQNPKDCKNARKLICSLNKGCGYGCQMHHILYCFIVSYATKRTMIIDSTGWRYSARGWNAYFQPVSDSCIHSGNGEEWDRFHDKARVVHLPIVDSMFPRPPQMPLSVPKDLYNDIRKFHGHPFVWWISQFTKYLFKFQPNIRKEIEDKKHSLVFKRPIVGVQVRRTDKINLEAAFHGIEEYMYWVDLYYKKLALTETFDKKRVFIASDDATVLSDARKKYPEYEFLSDNDVSRAAGLQRRYSDESLHGVISDIEILSDTDFLICTFSSQVCRMAYEIMNNKHTDASQRFRSLDDIYYFGGQQEHRMKAIWPHEAQGRSELDLKVGDIIGIAGNHWDGQAKGLHHASQRTGLFPAYKVEDVHDVADFPVYDDE